MTHFAIVQDQSVNIMLKIMWKLNNMLANGIPLSATDREFYNDNLSLIKNYYENKRDYWADKEPIK